MRHTRTRDERGERGSVMVIAALAMTALLLFAALAIDVGAIWSSRTQSQNANDAAALAAAAAMIQPNGTNPATVDLAGARAAGALYAGANATVGVGSVKVVPADFEFGNWNLATRTLDTGVDLTSPEQVTGVRLAVRMDGTDNEQSPAFLSRLLGVDGFDVRNVATGYLGFEGGFTAGEFVLPVAIDSCDLSTGGCGPDYCATVASPPNPCSLKWAQGSNPVTCLEFASTPEQNACWTAYDDQSPSINNPKLQQILDNGSPEDMQAGDRVYLDNGTKDETLKDIRNMFYGCKNNGTECGAHSPKGEDRYGPDPAGSPGSAPRDRLVGGEAARLRVPDGCALLWRRHVENHGWRLLRDPRDPRAFG